MRQRPNQPSTHPIVQTYRGARIAAHTLVGLILSLTVVPVLNHPAKQRLTRWWCAGVLKRLNIRVVTKGEPPYKQQSGKLYVANHISWVDIHALNSVTPLRFVAKSEIRRWPVFGFLASQAGTLFIDRNDRKGAIHIIQSLKRELENGAHACYFPEGTTSDGTQILPFKGSIIQAALAAKTDVIPVAIRYPLSAYQIDTRLAYAGDTSLIESIRNILRIPNPTVELHFLEPVSSHGQNRQIINQQARQAICQRLDIN